VERREERRMDARSATRVRIEGKLTNTAGEFIASGPCEVDLDRAEVTMWPSWEMHMLERERGELGLDLADGTRMRISDRHLTFKLAGPQEQRVTVYRLRILERVPDHMTQGYLEPVYREPGYTEPSSETVWSDPVADETVREGARQ
jgi:hypothetical protein